MVDKTTFLYILQINGSLVQIEENSRPDIDSTSHSALVGITQGGNPRFSLMYDLELTHATFPLTSPMLSTLLDERKVFTEPLWIDRYSIHQKDDPEQVLCHGLDGFYLVFSNAHAK